MTSVQLGYTGRYLVWSDSHKAMKELNRPRVDEQTIRDLVAFLHALSSERLVQRLTAKETDMSDQRQLAINGVE
jgi:hypothetical protein